MAPTHLVALRDLIGARRPENPEVSPGDRHRRDRGDTPCTWCSLIADFEAGEPVAVSGGQAWSAMVAQPLTPARAFGHLLHDVRRYRVVRPDTLEAA